MISRIPILFPLLLALAPAPAAAQPYCGLGPFETTGRPGNLGAPRSADPETRFGALLFWARSGLEDALGGYTVDGLSLLFEAHLEIADAVEVGVDIEGMQFVNEDVPDGAVGRDDRNEASFGFLVPRVKWAFWTHELLTTALSMGLLLPTATGAAYEAYDPLALDPAFHLAVRPLDWISINVSLPFVVDLTIPDVGSTSAHGYFLPSVGITLMPIDAIGGFVDLQTHVQLDADDGDDALNLLLVSVGLRSRPAEWLLLEAGVEVPAAGLRSDRPGDAYSDEIFFGFRIAATPDLL